MKSLSCTYTQSCPIHTTSQRLLLVSKFVLIRKNLASLIRTEITVVDFSVTEVGLEEQILAVVVDKEHPELEKQRSDLIRVQNESTIHLKQLEDRLLSRLAASSQSQSGQLAIRLEDIELIENLQATKADIESKVVQFIATEKEINRKRNIYRPVAAVSAMLYFIIDKLSMLDHMYQYSFLTFMALVTSTIASTEGGHHLEEGDTHLVHADSVSAGYDKLRLGILLNFWCSDKPSIKSTPPTPTAVAHPNVTELKTVASGKPAASRPSSGRAAATGSNAAASRPGSAKRPTTGDGSGSSSARGDGSPELSGDGRVHSV